MAEVKDTKEVKAIDYSKLHTKLQANMKGVSEQSLFTGMGNTKNYISSGNYMFDAMFTGSIYGGAPDARITEIAGESGAGKTFICLNLAMSSVKMNRITYYVETEGAIDDEDLTRFGFDDYEGGLFKRIDTLQTFGQVTVFLNEVADMKRNNPEVDYTVFIDSLACMLTDKELEDIAKGKFVADMGARAKAGRQMFRTVGKTLSNLNIPIIFTNQTSANIDMFATKKTNIGGGGGPKYSASYVFEITKKDLNERYDTKNRIDKVSRNGILVKVTQDKNRKIRPHTFEMFVEFDKGWNKYKGLEDFILAKNDKGEIDKGMLIENSWELFGLANGAIYREESFKEKFGNKPPMNSKKEELKVHKFEKDGNVFYCVENPNLDTIAVKDTCCNVGWAQHMLTKHIFTENTLKMLDENVIQPALKFKNDIDDEIEELDSTIKSAY